MSLQARTLKLIGGRQVVGREARHGVELAKLVRRGLPFGAVQHLVDSGHITLVELDQVAIARKTLDHRRKLGSLTPEQSDRLVRVARVIAAAEETFGGKDKAHTWLRRPTAPLSGERPIDLLDTDEGARAVEALLGRISHGIAA